jgi:glycosyltransferase involved in cell wall biosynthesis
VGKENPLRLLIVTEDLRVGGAEVVAADLAGVLTEQSWQVFIAPIRDGGSMREAFKCVAEEVFPPLARRHVDVLAPWRIARLILRHRIDCVVVLDPLRNGLFYAAVGSLLSGRKVLRLCWCHSWPGGQAGNFAASLRAYYRLGLLDAVVCIGPSQRRCLREHGLPWRALPLVPNGLDFHRLLGPATDLVFPPGRKVVLQVANVMPDKDFDTLLAAMQILAQQRRDFHLVLAGRGTDSPAMRQAVADRGLTPFVTLGGHRNDVAGLLAASDVFVLSSRSETFPLAPLEAMAAGVPVVASDLPAFDDLFTAGREGLKVPPGDAKALAQALALLIEDGELSQELAAAGARRAEAFSASTMAGRFCRLVAALQRSRHHVTNSNA